LRLGRLSRRHLSGDLEGTVDIVPQVADGAFELGTDRVAVATARRLSVRRSIGGGLVRRPMHAVCGRIATGFPDPVTHDSGILVRCISSEAAANFNGRNAPGFSSVIYGCCTNA